MQSVITSLWFNVACWHVLIILKIAPNAINIPENQNYFRCSWFSDINSTVSYLKLEILWVIEGMPETKP